MAGTSPKFFTSWHSEDEADLEEIEVALYGLLHHATPADDADFSLPLTKSSSSLVLPSSPSQSNVGSTVSVLPSHLSSSEKQSPRLIDIQELPNESKCGFFIDVGQPQAAVQESITAESLISNVSSEPAVHPATQKHVLSLDKNANKRLISTSEGAEADLQGSKFLEQNVANTKAKDTSGSNLLIQRLRNTGATLLSKAGQEDRGSSSEEDSKYVAISQSLKSKTKMSAPKPFVFEDVISADSSPECELLVEDRQVASPTVELVDLIETSEDSEIELIELRNGVLPSKNANKRQLRPARCELPSASKKAKLTPVFTPPAHTSTPALGTSTSSQGFVQSRVVVEEETVVSEEADMVLNISTPRRKKQPPAASEVDQIISDSFRNIEPIDYEEFACKNWTQAMRDFYDYIGKDPDLDRMHRQLPEHGWWLSDDDRYGLYKHAQRNRYFRGKLLRCANCHQPDHITRKCPEPVKPRVCHRCGEQGHTEYLCNKKMCLQCATVLGAYTESCHNCLEFKFITCSICGLKGHPVSLCPDTWRRYHVTTKPGPLQQLPHERPNKPLSTLFCANCTKCGHLAYQCPAYRNSPYPRYFPYIASYEDTRSEELSTVHNSSLAPVVNTAHSRKVDRFEALLCEWGPALKFYYKFKFPYALDAKSLSDIKASKKKVEDNYPNVAAVLQLSKKNDSTHLVEFWGTAEPACLKARRLFKKTLRECRKTKQASNDSTSLNSDSLVNESVDEPANLSGSRSELSFLFKSHCPFRFTFPEGPEAVAYVEKCKNEVEKAYPAVSVSIITPSDTEQYVTDIRGLSNQLCNKAKDYFQKLIQEYTPTNIQEATSCSLGPSLSNMSTEEPCTHTELNVQVTSQGDSEASTSKSKAVPVLDVENETDRLNIREPKDMATSGDESRMPSDSEDVSVAEHLPSTGNTSFNTLVANLNPYLESNCKMYLPLKDLPLERLSALKSKVEEAVGHLAVTINTIGLRAHKVLVKFWGRECWRGKQLFKMWFNEEVEAHENNSTKEPTATDAAEKPGSSGENQQKKKQLKKTTGTSQITKEEEEQVMQGKSQEFVQNLGPQVHASAKFSVNAKKWPMEFLDKIRVAVESKVEGMAVVVRKTKQKTWIEFYGNGDARAASKLFKKLVFGTANGLLDKPESLTQQTRIRISYTDKHGKEHVFSQKIKLSPKSQKEFLDKVIDLERTYQVSVGVNREPTVLTVSLKGRRSNEAFKHVKNVIYSSRAKR